MPIVPFRPLSQGEISDNKKKAEAFKKLQKKQKDKPKKNYTVFNRWV